MGKILIPGGGGGADLDIITAKSSDILKDKVIVGPDGEPLVGTMPNNPSPTATLQAGESKQIPLGYNPGGTVTAASLASQTSGNATAPQILAGQTAWVNGNKITGSMGNYSGKTSTSNYVSSTFRSATTGYVFASPGSTGYYTTGSYLRIPAANLSAANIKKGVPIMGIIGTWEGFVPGPYDIYNRGAWGSGYGTASVTPFTSSSTHNYYPTHIESWGPISSSSHRRSAPWVCISKNGSRINLQPYKTINVVYTTDDDGSAINGKTRLELVSNDNIRSDGSWTLSEKTLTLDISNVNVTDFIYFRNISDTDVSGMGDKFNIYRVYFT